ncbi:hypothetical protein HDU85_003706 [Gaertneriomyces sp. JEL0708]|nr:hypothetical protein HDU85_003706 [Gaertneriomyces sp. JEL0708]
MTRLLIAFVLLSVASLIVDVDAFPNTVPFSLWSRTQQINFKPPTLASSSSLNALFANVECPENAIVYVSDNAKVDLSTISQQPTVTIPYLDATVDQVVDGLKAKCRNAQVSVVEIKGNQLLARDSISNSDLTIITSHKPTSTLLQKRQPVPSPTQKPWSQRSLFEKYNYFSAGLFMAIFAMIPVVLVALMGVRILGSVQVPTKWEKAKKEGRNM